MPENKEQNIEEIVIEARRENLDQVLGFMDAHLERRDCPMKVMLQLDIAVEELFVNIANYAYGDQVGQAVIQLQEEHDPEGISITFIDEGMPFDPLAKPDPDVTLGAMDRSVGGLGIYMVKKSMDDMKYRYEDNRNILTIRKNLEDHG